MERLSETEESLEGINAQIEDELSATDIFSFNDLDKRRIYLMKRQNDIPLDDLLRLCDEKDFYLKTKSIEIACKVHTNTLRDNHNSLFWQFVRNTLTTEQDYEIVNFLLKCLRNFFLENLVNEEVDEELCTDLSQSVVLTDKERMNFGSNDQQKDVTVDDINLLNIRISGYQPTEKGVDMCYEENTDDGSAVFDSSKFLPYSKRYNQRRKIEDFRVLFISDAEIQHRLLSFVEMDDLCYNTLFLFWLLSFTKEVFEKLNPVDLIGALANKIKKDSLDKIFRMACLIFMNIKKHDLFISLKNLHLMLNTSKIMLNRKSEDLEYNHDKKELYNYVMKKIKNVSSVENYLKELYSGHLEPTLYHFEESFWNVNLTKLQIKKHEIIKAIRLYLKRGERQNVVMALNDLLMFHNVDASIGRLIENYGVKDQLIELCGSNDNEIQFLALQAFLSVLNQQLY